MAFLKKLARWQSFDDCELNALREEAGVGGSLVETRIEDTVFGIISFFPRFLGRGCCCPGKVSFVAACASSRLGC